MSSVRSKLQSLVLGWLPAIFLARFNEPILDRPYQLLNDWIELVGILHIFALVFLALLQFSLLCFFPPPTARKKLLLTCPADKHGAFSIWPCVNRSTEPWRQAQPYMDHGWTDVLLFSSLPFAFTKCNPETSKSAPWISGAVKFPW